MLSVARASAATEDESKHPDNFVLCHARLREFYRTFPPIGNEKRPRCHTQVRCSPFTLVSVMDRKALFFLLALSLVSPAHAENIKEALNHKYRSHILGLRAPF